MYKYPDNLNGGAGEFGNRNGIFGMGRSLYVNGINDDHKILRGIFSINKNGCGFNYGFTNGEGIGNGYLNNLDKFHYSYIPKFFSSYPNNLLIKEK